MSNITKLNVVPKPKEEYKYRLLCLFGIHLWSKWSVTSFGRYVGSKRMYAELIKNCSRCGYVKLKTEKEY